MNSCSSYVFISLGLLWLLIFVSFSLTSRREKEYRASRISIILAIAGFGLFTLTAYLPYVTRMLALLALTLIAITLIILFIIPKGKATINSNTPSSRFDERDIMFARANLEPGSPEYKMYYAMRPENEAPDEITRNKPGLLSLESQLANPFLFASTEGSFSLTKALREAVDGTISDTKQTQTVEQITSYLKNLAYYYGALQVGMAELHPYHVYSHVGRGTGVYGEPIPIRHRYAIAFTMEMDFQMVGTSPEPQISMETARRYVEGAQIAVQLASAIRYLGYSARGHINGNYQVIAPLVARDAGLGEIGRMGLLITPRTGPRVRIGVVTTDIELKPDIYRPNLAVIDFCTICKKCAENCPSRSIPFGEQVQTDGAWRWRINSDSCFLYWNIIGTDCGRCMAVCPFSHPDSLYHNWIRWGISRSGFFRRFSLKLDDLFYGRKPIPRKAPGWTRIS